MSVLGNSVVQFGQTNLGSQVGNGECWTLGERALTNAGARTSTDIMGRVGGDENYVWGTTIAIANLEAGDMIQFRNYTFHLENADGGWSEQERPHHTAILISAPGGGVVEVYESNVNGSRNVQRNRLYLQSGSVAGGGVTVQGQIWCYRPIQK